MCVNLVIIDDSEPLRYIYCFIIACMVIVQYVVVMCRYDQSNKSNIDVRSNNAFARVVIWQEHSIVGHDIMCIICYITRCMLDRMQINSLLHVRALRWLTLPFLLHSQDRVQGSFVLSRIFFK